MTPSLPSKEQVEEATRSLNERGYAPSHPIPKDCYFLLLALQRDVAELKAKLASLEASTDTTPEHDDDPPEPYRPED